MVERSRHGHDRRLRMPSDTNGQGDRRRRTGLVRAEGQPGALGHRHHQPEAGTRRIRRSRTSPSASPTAAARPSRKSPARSPSAARRRRSGRSANEAAEQLSGHFAVVLDNEVKTRPIINFAENPDGIDGRNGAQISGGFNSIQEAQDLATFLQIGALPINLKLISQTQVSATLGEPGAAPGDQGRASSASPWSILFLLALLPLPRPDRGDRRSAPTG